MCAAYIDYLVADEIFVPKEQWPDHVEKIALVPHLVPSDRHRVIADRIFSREELGLPSRAFVFCCFNSVYKIAPAAFAGWMRILGQVEGSVLWLSGSNPIAVENLRKAAASHGIDPARLIFATFAPDAEYLARLRTADLFIDTFPFTAHTTAIAALWAGLPVVTRVGESFTSRGSASVLSAAGLPELVTSSQEDFEALAVSLSRDPARLAGLRRRLAENRLTCPLFDIASAARHLERVYVAIYERHLAGLPPDHIEI